MKIEMFTISGSSRWITKFIFWSNEHTKRWNELDWSKFETLKILRTSISIQGLMDYSFIELEKSILGC